MDNPIKINADLMGREEVEKELIKYMTLVTDELRIKSHARQLLVNIVNLKISLNKFMYLLTEEELEFFHNTATKNIKILHGMNNVLVRKYNPD
jgi:hypothetical protein